jgi:hypothetical protein
MSWLTSHTLFQVPIRFEGSLPRTRLLSSVILCSPSLLTKQRTSTIRCWDSSITYCSWGRSVILCEQAGTDILLAAAVFLRILGVGRGNTQGQRTSSHDAQLLV